MFCQDFCMCNMNGFENRRIMVVVTVLISLLSTIVLQRKILHNDDRFCNYQIFAFSLHSPRKYAILKLVEISERVR